MNLQNSLCIVLRKFWQSLINANNTSLHVEYFIIFKTNSKCLHIFTLYANLVPSSILLCPCKSSKFFYETFLYTLITLRQPVLFVYSFFNTSCLSCLSGCTKRFLQAGNCLFLPVQWRKKGDWGTTSTLLTQNWTPFHSWPQKEYRIFFF